MKEDPAPAIADSRTDPILRQSSFFRHCLAERDAINRHRRSLSDQATKEVSFDEALVDWMVKKRAQWLSRQKRATT